MSPIDELVPLLKKLRLSGILQSLELRIEQAAQDNLAPAEFLLRLCTDEVEWRDARMLEQRIRGAHFEHSKTLEDLDFHFNPQLPRSRSIDLATAGFVVQRRNVLLLGPSVVGKSHIAQALGQRACRLGHKVLFITVHDLLKQLRAARGDASHERKMLRFTGPALLILDDLGLRRSPPRSPRTSTTSSASAMSAAPSSSSPTVRSRSCPRSSAIRCWRAPPWIACSMTPTSSSSRATPIAIHHQTSGRPSATLAAVRKQPHETTHRGRSLWPPRVLPSRCGQRRDPVRGDHRITLAAPSPISLGAP